MTASQQWASNSRADLREMTRRANQNLVDSALVYGDGALHPFTDTYVIPTTAIDDANDFLRLLQFPPGAYIWSLRATFSDTDTNATPTLVQDLVVTDSADAVKAVLINDTTAGQSGATDMLDEAAVGEFVGAYYLALKTVTVSATPAAGTVKIALTYSIGTLKPSAGPNPLMTDGAV